VYTIQAWEPSFAKVAFNYSRRLPLPRLLLITPAVYPFFSIKIDPLNLEPALEVSLFVVKDLS